MDLFAVEEAIRPSNIHYPPTTLLCLENTHNRCGGAVLPAEYTAAAVRLAHAHGDSRARGRGANIQRVGGPRSPPGELARGVDSVSFCLSKGLSAPVGSMLCGDRDLCRQPLENGGRCLGEACGKPASWLPRAWWL